MADEARALFVFDDAPDPMVFASIEEAAGYMEAIDVENGEFVALYTLDGRVVRATTSGNAVRLEITTETNEHDLRRRVRELATGDGTLTSNPEDLVAVANELMRRRWESRWPKRPRWLSRRIHGVAPVSALPISRSGELEDGS